MCKYCKHLEEERFLERKDHQRVVDDWKIRCSKLESLLRRCLPIVEDMTMIQFFSSNGDLLVGKDDLVRQIKKELEKVYVGR